MRTRSADGINVGLYPRIGRTPTGATTRADADVTNGAGYLQNAVSLFAGRLQRGGGLRYDLFRISVRDLVEPAMSGGRYEGRVQPKCNLAFTPSSRWPVTFYANYGRGISSTDARGIVRAPNGTQIATTDFFQAGTSHRIRRVSVTTDLFWIDRSNELVYIPDDGSLEFSGPSRAYGFETKTSVEIWRSLSFDAGLTKVLNSFYVRTLPREYVDRAPHFVANAGLTLSSRRGWSGSVRLRAINHYRLDTADPTIVASGHTVADLSIARRLRKGVDFNLALDNFTGKFYYETQNYFVSRLAGQPPIARIHGTPGYPLTVTAGLTFRFRSK